MFIEVRINFKKKIKNISFLGFFDEDIFIVDM